MSIQAPQRESASLNANSIVFNSQMFKGRCPEGHTVVTGYFGGARSPAIIPMIPRCSRPD
ncbi:MAG: hypothetical protein ACO3UX_04075, partial [Candidatus Nanopelagicales bacterium]